jgi:hypothetical protein
LLTVHAYIEVTDLQRGIDFYCGGLGSPKNGSRTINLATTAALDPS